MKIVSEKKTLAAVLSEMMLLTGCAVNHENTESWEETARSNEEAQVSAGADSGNMGFRFFHYAVFHRELGILLFPVACSCLIQYLHKLSLVFRAHICFLVDHAEPAVFP